LDLSKLYCEESCPYAIVFKGVSWGPHWDSDPYCINLSNASKGMHAIPYITVATQALLAPTGDAPIEQSKAFKMLRKGNC